MRQKFLIVGTPGRHDADMKALSAALRAAPEKPYVVLANARLLSGGDLAEGYSKIFTFCDPADVAAVVRDFCNVSADNLARQNIEIAPDALPPAFNYAAPDVIAVKPGELPRSVAAWARPAEPPPEPPRVQSAGEPDNAAPADVVEEEVDLDAMTKAQLVAFAADNDVSARQSWSREKIIDAIMAKMG